MAAASTWLAGLAGGIDGVVGERHRDEDLALANRKVDNAELAAQVRAMLEQVKEEGRNRRTDVVEGGKNTRTDRVETGKSDRFYDAEAGKDSRFYTGEEGKNSRLDKSLEQGAEQYWDKAGRDWSGMMMGDATRRRGQDVGAATATRGQDLVHSDRQDSIDAGSDSRAMGYALRAYDEELKRKKGSGPFGGGSSAPSFDEFVNSSDDPEIFPSVRAKFGRSAAPAAPAPSVPGEGLPTARPAMPGARKPAAAAPQGLQPGATVTLRNGKKVKVTKVNPDGTFEYQ